MPKYGAVAKLLVEEGIVAEGGFHAPGPANAEWIALAHDRRYVDQVLSANVPDDIARMIGFRVDESIAERARHAGAGTVLTARLALEQGIACSTAGGSHHAKRAHGAGFCVFNDVGIAASLLVADGTIGSALVFDCDVHQGDGTADIFREDTRVRTVSIHAEKNYPVRKERSDLDVGLPDGTEDAAYLEALKDTLERSLALITPDIVFYNAGVDPHRDDRLGRLALSSAGLAERDRQVIGFFRDRGMPVAGVMGGGYSADVDEVARRHIILHRVASEFAG
ncbi:MAG: histone deacetylase [Pseudomonadota bacterium]|nr:histone deacetylase [Pseudomonadota bacterium]